MTGTKTYLEAMVGVLGAALGHAQIRKADLVKDHRLLYGSKRKIIGKIGISLIELVSSKLKSSQLFSYSIPHPSLTR